MRTTTPVFFLCFMLPLLSFAQSGGEKMSSRFSIEGEVAHPASFALDSIQYLGPKTTVDSLVIYTHDMKPRHTIHHLEGVLLKDILSTVKLTADNPKDFSGFYFVCEASDGYKVIFSWNELFNTETGLHAMLITTEENKPATGQSDRIALISPTDKATGRRYVKWLSRITVARVK